MNDNNDARPATTEQEWPVTADQPLVSTAPPAYGSQVAPAGQYAPAAYGTMPPAPYGMRPPGPLGQVRSTGGCIALTIVTFGIYSLYWYYKTHEEMKAHSGEGLGGGVALLIAFFIGIVSPFLSASEVGKLYERRGMRAPVSGVTGLWFLLLSWFFLVGAIVWFVKVNGALNAYWRSQGAV